MSALAWLSRLVVPVLLHGDISDIWSVLLLLSPDLSSWGFLASSSVSDLGMASHKWRYGYDRQLQEAPVHCNLTMGHFNSFQPWRIDYQHGAKVILICPLSKFASKSWGIPDEYLGSASKTWPLSHGRVDLPKTHWSWIRSEKPLKDVLSRQTRMELGRPWKLLRGHDKTWCLRLKLEIKHLWRLAYYLDLKFSGTEWIDTHHCSWSQGFKWHSNLSWSRSSLKKSHTFSIKTAVHAQPLENLAVEWQLCEMPREICAATLRKKSKAEIMSTTSSLTASPQKTRYFSSWLRWLRCWKRWRFGIWQMREAPI